MNQLKTKLKRGTKSEEKKPTVLWLYSEILNKQLHIYLLLVLSQGFHVMWPIYDS